MLLQPLPFREPDRLVEIWETHPELRNLEVAVPDYLDWKRSFKTLDAAAYTFQAMDKATLLGRGKPIAVQGTNASAELFPLLGIQPILGRLYDATDEREKHPVILISEQLWRRSFSSDSQVIGRSLQLDQTAFTVVGVLPQKSLFPSWADVWVPLSLTDKFLYSERKYHPLEVIGRVKPGVSLHTTEVEVEEVARQLSSAYPVTNGKIGAMVIPLLDAVIGEVRPALTAVWIAVGLLLLMGCANLGHLMMSRALARRQEVAVLLALGATRFTIFRVFWLETSVLAITGGLLGLLAAALALPTIQYLSAGQVPRLEALQLNGPVLLFGIVISAAVALLFALPSYLLIMRADLSETISSGNVRSSARQSRLSSLMMACEVALCVSILLAAILLVRSFSLTLQTPAGFRPDHVLAVQTPLVNGDWKKSYEFFRDRLAPELSGIPGIEKVAAVNSIPMSLGPTEHSRFATRFGIVGRQFEPGRFPTAQIRWCTPNYFDVLGIPLIRGRLLKEADHSQPHYLINETLARRFFPHVNPVGQKLQLGVTSPNPEVDEIAGVVGDVRELGLTVPSEPTLYLIDVSTDMQVVMKSATNDGALQSTLAATIQRINPQQAAGSVKTLDSYVAASLARQRFVLALIATFAALAIFLCVVGLYGVFNYSVTRRIREFGIRTAVGARRGDLLLQITNECLVVVLPGLAAGLGISAACSRLMRTLLYEVSPTDGLSSALAALGVLACCLGSVMLPALRAGRVDPAVVLRAQ